jgi:hypothetical protein
VLVLVLVLVLAGCEEGNGEEAAAPQEGGGSDHRRRRLAGFISVVCVLCMCMVSKYIERNVQEYHPC